MVRLHVSRLVGAPVAALIGNDNPESGFGEGIYLLGPEPAGVGEAVEKQHRCSFFRAVQLDIELDAATVYLHVFPLFPINLFSI